MMRFPACPKNGGGGLQLVQGQLYTAKELNAPALPEGRASEANSGPCGTASARHDIQEPMTPRIDNLLAAQEENALQVLDRAQRTSSWEARSPDSRVDVLVGSLQAQEPLEDSLDSRERGMHAAAAVNRG